MPPTKAFKMDRQESIDWTRIIIYNEDSVVILTLNIRTSVTLPMHAEAYAVALANDLGYGEQLPLHNFAEPPKTKPRNFPYKDDTHHD